MRIIKLLKVPALRLNKLAQKLSVWIKRQTPATRVLLTPHLNAQQGGFTIIELLIATAIFAIILLTALAGFTEIGRIFYKGVSTTGTQNIANQISQDILGNFTTAEKVSGPNSYKIPSTADSIYAYYCVGNTRYTYNLNYRLDTSTSSSHAAPASKDGGNFGLLRDVLPGSSACAAPCNDQGTDSCPPSTVKFNNPTEMLGDNMRLSAFSIQPDTGVSANFYNISIVIAYGDDSRLAYTDPGDLSTVYCAGNSRDQQFCSISRINTGVYRGDR